MLWTEVELSLYQLQVDASVWSQYYKKRYNTYKHGLAYFQVPVLVLSLYSVVCYCLGSGCYMLCYLTGFFHALELLCSVRGTMSRALQSSRCFHGLSVEIYKTLKLPAEHRVGDPQCYWREKYQIYCKLLETS